MNRWTAIVLTVMLACSGLLSAQIGYIYTYAGNPNGSFPGNGGPATNAIITNPAGLAIDPVGNLYIAASGNSLIRLVNANTGIITTVAGGGTGGDGGLATAAQLANPCDMKLDPWGNLYLSETCVSAQGGGGGGGAGGIARIRRVDAITGIITTVAGGTNSGFAGDGGPATSALLNLPTGLAIDVTGNIFLADSGNNRIRRIDAGTGYISTVAGNGLAAFAGDGGLATSASLNSPAGVAVDDSGNLYIADMLNNVIRRVDGITGIITTVAGTGAAGFNGDGIAATGANLYQPANVILNSGNLVIADFGNNRVRTIDNSGMIWTTAGDGNAAASGGQIGDGSPASLAVLSHPFGLAARPSEPLFIAELTGNRVREDGLPNSIAATAVTVSSTSATAPVGTPVTLTASLAASNGLASNAGGGVYFFDGTSTMIGSGAIVNGSASMTTSSLALGVHNVSAQYIGSSGFGGSVSPVFALTITNPAPTLSFSANPNPAPANQPVSLTVYISPSSATGTVTFYNGATALGSTTLSSGAATLSVPGFTPGTYSLTAQYGGDASHSAAVSPVLSLTVKNSTSIALTSSLNPSSSGQSVTFSAAITPATATGTLLFLDGGTQIGSATIVSGTASFSTSALTTGPHYIAVSYSGDANDASVLSTQLTQTVNPKTATTATVTSTLNPAPSGSPVTLNATVSPAAATGTMQFLDGATVLGTIALASGSASFTTSALTTGSHSITVVYSGDAVYAGSTSPAITQKITAATTVTLTSNQNPVLVGASVILTAAVSPATATGTVQFLDGATVLGTGTLTSGSATFSTSTMAVGAHSITAQYSGDAGDNGSTSAVLAQTINAKATTTVVTSSVNPLAVGNPVEFAATVSAGTGTVQFFDGAASLGTASLIGTTAQLVTSALTQGTHSITAVYGGDATNASSTSAVYSQVVKLNAGLNILTSLDPSVIGQAVTFTATLNAAATGTVQFLDGGTVLSTVTVSGGSATFTTSSLALGAHVMNANYSGDSNYASQLSSGITQTVNPKANTSTTVASASNPAFVGAAMTFTATVSPATATGTMQFLDGATVLGTGALASGSASFTTSTLTTGAHSITAVYSGDAVNAGSTSAVLTQTINAKANTVTTITSTPNPAFAATAVTFAATVSPSTATGTVQFLDGSTVLGTGALANGLASFSTSTLAQGAHSITAVYTGDAADAGSTSAMLSQAMRVSAGMTVGLTPSPAVVGQTVRITANLAAAATGTVQFTDGGTVLATVPVSGGSASYSTTTLALGSHTLGVAYSGDATYMSQSTTFPETVLAASTVALVSNANPSLAGQSATFTASVTPSTATGTIQFFDGGTLIGTVSLASGAASFATASLARGAHSISATYGGDASDAAASSGTLNQVVRASASVALTSSLNPSTAGQALTFSASVTPSMATGTVQFLDGSTVLGTVNLNSGSAALSTSGLAVGAHSITASYSGDSFDTAATSAALPQTVNAGAPGAPSNLTATAAGSSQINLAWTASATSGVTYNVYESITPGFTPSVANRIASGVASTTYSATGLSPSTAFYFLVTAVNAGGESAATNQATATTAGGLACHVGYSVTNQWNTGFTGAITIHNTGATKINSWTLTWAWPGNQAVTQSWNATETQSGPNVTLTDMSYNKQIAAGATLTGVGFNASYSGSNPAPTAFYINGTHCQ
jgi:hypothetical protein